MQSFVRFLCLVSLFYTTVFGFSTAPARTSSIATSTTALANKPDDNDEFMRWARQSRSADVADNVVEFVRPIGIVLNEDDRGNVFVEKIAPRGNAARTGKVQVGDIVTMCSATFGNDMWSTRGVGLSRVLAAIRVRSGLVRLVFESPSGYKKKKVETEAQLTARAQAEAAAQAKRDGLLSELENDEAKLKGQRKFFGLF